MFANQSVMGLSAAVLYMSVAASCVLAAYYGSVRSQSRRDIYQWIVIALLFMLLTASRAVDFEEGFRQSMRLSLKAEEAYGTRRDSQRPLAAAAIVVFSAATFWLIYRFSQRSKGRRDLALGLSGLAALAMAALVALRLTSLHQIDRVLFGPLKLNWFADIGSSLAVMAAAIFYIRLIRKRR